MVAEQPGANGSFEQSMPLGTYVVGTGVVVVGTGVVVVGTGVVVVGTGVVVVGTGVVVVGTGVVVDWFGYRCIRLRLCSLRSSCFCSRSLRRSSCRFVNPSFVEITA